MSNASKREPRRDLCVRQELEEAVKGLAEAHTETCRFIAGFKRRPVGALDAVEYSRLMTAELKAIIDLTDLEIGLKQGRGPSRRTI